MNKNTRFGYLKSHEEIHKIHIGRNQQCPCGKKVDKIYTDEDGREQVIPTPVKYKNCCINKGYWTKKKNQSKNLSSLGVTS